MAARKVEWADRMKKNMTLIQAMRTHDLALAAANRSQSLRGQYQLVHGRFLEYLAEQGIIEPTISHLNPEHVRGFTLTVGVTPTVNTLTGAIRSRGPRTVQSHVLALKALGHFLVDERRLKE